ncbi:MAG: 3-oxoadipate enol-lactonase [Roseinatronobacter sp.]|nr:3-oxoadipate enol-lactonase [Roseinatronobacter sp.]
MKTFRHGTTTLHYADQGPYDGPAVLFANSLGTDLRIWEPLLPYLRPGLRIIRYDKRGHGLSDTLPAPYTMDELTDEAAALLEHLSLQRVTVVGLSIGGMIAQNLAARPPDLVGALVLMDTAAKIGTVQMWHERIAAIRAHGIAALSQPILERWFAPEFHSTRPDELALWRNMLCRTSLEGYLGCCAAIAAADLTAQTRALRLPAIAMAGSADGATPPELVQTTAGYLNAPFSLIDGAGHLPCVEAPQQVAALINQFLAEHIQPAQHGLA